MGKGSLAAVVAAAVLVASCAPFSDQSIPSATNEFGEQMIMTQNCSGDCGLAVAVGGQYWDLDCLVIDEQSLGDEFAVAGTSYDVDSMRVIADVDPEVMVAARMSDGHSFCPAEMLGGRDISKERIWVSAYGPAPAHIDETAARARARAICEHGVNPSEADRCDEGGHIQWYPDPAAHDVDQRIGYFPEYQQEVEDQLAGGEGPQWRSDPLLVASEFWTINRSICMDEHARSSYRQCRFGLFDPVVTAGGATLRGLLQWAPLYGDDQRALYETSEYEFQLESTGNAWWVTVVLGGRESTEHGWEDEGRQKSDDVWADCCALVVADIEG